MKANEMPEKIYLFDYNDAMVTPIEGDTVYVMEDAFIEKACEWLSKHAKKYYFNKEGHYLGTDELVEDFKIVMRL